MMNKIGTAKRDSNIELVRVLSMIFVLIVHANFGTFGYPSTDDFIVHPYSAFSRTLLQSCALICVNLFVFISGWYGIHVKKQRFLGLLFQVYYFSSIILLLLFFLYGKEAINMSHLKSFLIIDDYWFVKAYLFLYILSPLLNAFIENTNRQRIKQIILVYSALICIYGFLFGAEHNDWVQRGFSPLSFVMIYLWARYIRVFQPTFSKWSKTRDVTIYVFFSILTAIWYSLHVLYGLPFDATSYVSPFVLISTVFFFLYFSKVSINSTIINWLGAASFSVYLFHNNQQLILTKLLILKYAVHTTTCLQVMIIVLILCLIYLLASLLDQIRAFLWKKISFK